MTTPPAPPPGQEHAAAPPPYPSPYPPPYPSPYPPPHWAPPPPAPRTEGMAIAALVLGLLTPLGVPFGIVALRRIRRTGAAGRGLAIAGIVVGAFQTVVLTIGVIGIATALASNADRDASGVIVGAGNVGIDQLRVGDCLVDLDDDGGTDPTRFSGVPCAAPHEGEVFAVFELPEGPYPGRASLAATTEEECGDRLTAYSPSTRSGGDVELLRLEPRDIGWDLGFRNVVCIAVSSTPTTGPLPR